MAVSKELFEEVQSNTSIREKLSKYTSNWPMFIISTLICVALGILYTRYTVPKHTVTTSFIIKGLNMGIPYRDDLIESSVGSIDRKEGNLGSEMLLIGSTDLMERTVAKNNFNITYHKKGRVLDVEIYKDAPFTLISNSTSDSIEAFSLFLKKVNLSGGSFVLSEKEGEKIFSFEWNKPFNVNGHSFMLSPKSTFRSGDGGYIVSWEPISKTAQKFLEELVVKVQEIKNQVVPNVLQLVFKSGNIQKGKDVLNGLYTEFNLTDIENRTKISENTVRFIDDRLLAISGELRGVEGKLENYQGSNQIVDIKNQSSLSLENSNTVNKTIKDLAIQQGVVSMILAYFANPENKNKLVPSSLGINDATLSSLISQYNELQLRREREAPMVAPNSIVMQDLNSQLSNLKTSILESLNNIQKNLQLQESNFQQQNKQYKNVLSSIPHSERVLLEIKRTQSITEGLYLYLLQKREETAISSTSSNVAHYQQIDPAYVVGVPEPNETNIVIYAALLGLFLPFGLISARELLNDKVTSVSDISKRLTLPLLGQINHISKRKKQVLLVLDRNLIGEQFRSIRANLSLQLKDKNKNVILITSSKSNEGKSLISVNLAAVYAKPGKKVALLDLDLRQPSISNILNIDNTFGVADYLTGKVDEISDLYQTVKEVPSLHIYPAGSIAANPGDLLLVDRLNHLISALKVEYDYVIIDTPPAGVVSDPIIISDYTDITLFIIRQQKTSFKQLELINEMVNNNSLKNVTLILNDVKEVLSDKYDYKYESKPMSFKRLKQPKSADLQSN